jgi:hypothetical protein
MMTLNCLLENQGNHNQRPKELSKDTRNKIDKKVVLILDKKKKFEDKR